MVAPLLVSADDVGRRLGVPTPLNPPVLGMVEEAILDVQATVEGYLGVSPFPVTYTEDLYPAGYPAAYAPGFVGWPPSAYDPYFESKGWPVTHLPVISITSATAINDASGRPTGYYRVVYVAGLDGATIAPIVQYVKAWASVHPMAVRAAKSVGVEVRGIKSVSAEGQSVTYDDPAGSSGAIEARTKFTLPPLSTLDQWRVAGREVYQRRSFSNQYPGG